MTQKEYEERMKNTRYKELKVTNAEDEKDYVFISYRGNSWEKVLTDIVYKLQKEYGLRIYFDKDFASSNNILPKSYRFCKVLQQYVCVKYSLANFLTFFFYHCFLFFCTTNKPRLCAEQIFSI